MAAISLPRGSILSIEAIDLLGSPAGKIWNKVSEHNRSDLQFVVNRIEQSRRMSDGSLRKFFIADKKEFSTSWTMFPSYRTLTVEGGWGAEDLRSFYLSNDGKKAFNIKINLAKSGTDQTASGYESYTVMFKESSFNVIKRGLQPFWNVSISMEEV